MQLHFPLVVLSITSPRNRAYTGCLLLLYGMVEWNVSLEQLPGREIATRLRAQEPSQPALLCKMYRGQEAKKCLLSLEHLLGHCHPTPLVAVACRAPNALERVVQVFQVDECLFMRGLFCVEQDRKVHRPSPPSDKE